MAKKSFKVVTPKVPLVWSDVHTPSAFKPTETPAYQATALFDPKDKQHKAFMDDVYSKYEELYDTVFNTLNPVQKKSCKKLPIEEIFPEDFRVDKETDEVTYSGLVRLKASQKSQIKTKSGTREVSITVVDAAKQKIPKTIDIWNGSMGKLVITLEAFYMPDKKTVILVRRLAAVQIIDLKTAGNDGIDLLDIEGEGLDYEVQEETEEEFDESDDF